MHRELVRYITRKIEAHGVTLPNCSVQGEAQLCCYVVKSESFLGRYRSMRPQRLVGGGIKTDAHNGANIEQETKKRVVNDSSFLAILEHRQRRPQQAPNLLIVRRTA